MFFVEPLREGHDLSRFGCDNAELDDWLRRSSWNATLAGNARTRLWVDDSDEIVAYYATAPHHLVRDELPKAIARGAGSFIPCYLLSRLALSTELQGHPDRYGSLLLTDALAWLLVAAKSVGGKLVVVDAIDDRAADFYEHHGFKPTPVAGRLYMKASDIAGSLGEPWP